MFNAHRRCAAGAMITTALLAVNDLAALLVPSPALARQQSEKSQSESSAAGTTAARPAQAPLTLRDIREAIRQNPKDAMLYFQAGLLEERQSNWKQALKDYQMAIKFNSKWADAHYHVGIAWEQMGEVYYEGKRTITGPQRQKAIDSYRAAIRLQPDFGDAYYRLSVTYLMSDDLRRANEAYQKLALLEPDTNRTRQLLRLIYAYHQERSQKR